MSAFFYTFLFIVISLLFFIGAIAFIIIGIKKKANRFTKAGATLLALLILTYIGLIVRYTSKHKPELASHTLPGHYKGYKTDQNNISQDSLNGISLILFENGELDLSSNNYTPFLGKGRWEYNEKCSGCELSIYHKMNTYTSSLSTFDMGNEVSLNIGRYPVLNYLYFKKEK
jgi:hypothetical protein